MNSEDNWGKAWALNAQPDQPAYKYYSDIRVLSDLSAYRIFGIVEWSLCCYLFRVILIFLSAKWFRLSAKIRDNQQVKKGIIKTETFLRLASVARREVHNSHNAENNVWFTDLERIWLRFRKTGRWFKTLRSFALLVWIHSVLRNASL